jgi:hypothetical protein
VPAPATRARVRLALTLVMAAAALLWLRTVMPVLFSSSAHLKEWPRLVLLLFALPATPPLLAAVFWRGPATRFACAVLATVVFGSGLIGASVPAWNAIDGLSLAREQATVPVPGGKVTIWMNDCGATNCPPTTWIEQERAVIRGLHRTWRIAERRLAVDARVEVLPGDRLRVTWLGRLDEPLATETIALHTSAWTG